MTDPNLILAVVFNALELVFKNGWIAPLVLLPTMLVWAVFFWLRACFRSSPFIRAAKTRAMALRKALGEASDPASERNVFAENFGDVATAMGDRTRGSEPLVRAWHEFHESIVDETETPVRNTTRPMAFFLREIPKHRDLIFWSNTFVGIGLVLTFLGIVVALHSTAEGMKDGATAQESQAALRALLAIASVKFFTSIAGLLASLLLRFAEYRLTKKCERDVLAICDLLERGLLYVSPQVLAVLQLSELKRQSTQLEKFNTDLAMSIGEQVGQQFQSVMSPMQSSLGALSTSMEMMSDRLSDRLGEGVGKAIESATNGELRALGTTLEALRTQLEGLSQNVQGSGEDAAKQIRAAGADFAQAAADIRDAFSNLTGQVGDIGRNLTTATEEAKEKQDALLNATLSNFEATNLRTSEVMAKAVDALRDAGTSVASDLQERMGTAMTDAARQAEAVVRSAIEETGSAFAESGKALITAVDAAASTIAALAVSIERSERGAAGSATAFQASADGANSAANAMSEAANGFSIAASPVATAAKSFQDAASRISSSLDQSEKAAIESLKAMSSLAQEINDTQDAARSAWENYRSRFDGVDQSLEKTLLQMTSTLSDTMNEFRKFAQDIDTEMARAIGRLSSSMSMIEENNETLTDFVDAIRTRSKDTGSSV